MVFNTSPKQDDNNLPIIISTQRILDRQYSSLQTNRVYYKLGRLFGLKKLAVLD